MQTMPFPINVSNHDFPVIATASVSPDSEAIVIIDFKKPDGSKLSSAILLPAYTDLTMRYEPDIVMYPILFQNGEVNIRFGWHVNTPENIHTMLAFITAKSPEGAIVTRVHGL